MFKKFNIFTILMALMAVMFVLRVLSFAAEAESTEPPAKFEQIAEATPATPAEVAAAPTEPPGAAAAKEETKDTPKEEAKTAEAQTPPPMSSPYGEQGFSASEVEILQSLSKRREELDQRERQIGQREALLKAAGGEVDRKIAELNKIKSELEDLLNKQKGAEDERINSLVKIYENMKPKDAANIFNTLEMDVLLPVISKMSERKCSPILAAMDPEKARQLTIKIAEQKKLPSLPDDGKKDKAAKPAAP